jgi:hypothetical protein
MKRIILRGIVVALCLLALHASNEVHAAPAAPAWVPDSEAVADPVIRISPSSSVVAHGATFTIDVAVDNAVNLGAYDFTVAYDSVVLYAQNVSLGSFLGSTGNAAYWSTNEYSRPPVQVTAYAQGSNPGPSGSGTLAQIRMVAIATGASALTLSDVQLKDMQGNVLGPVTTTPGVVTVYEPEGVISGTVRYDDGTPAGNIRVTAALGSDYTAAQWWALTAADGSFSMPGPGQPPLLCGRGYAVTLDPETVPVAYTWTPLVASWWCSTTLSFQLVPFSVPAPAQSQLCSAPTALSPVSGTVACDSEVNLSWEGSCAEYNVEYEYYGSERQSSGWITHTWFDFVPPYSFHKGRTPLWWHVRCRDRLGAETAWSSLSMFELDRAPPRNVRAEALSCDEIELQWEETSCYPCVRYYGRCIGSDGSSGQWWVDSPATRCTVPTLNMSTVYSCAVTCISKSDTVTSDAVTATTLGTKTEQEAEDGVIVAPMEVAADPEASGGHYVYSPLGWEGGSTTLKLCVPEEGDYELWGRVRGLGWGADTFWVSVDGGERVVWEVPIGEWVWVPVSNREDSDDKTVQVYHFTAKGHVIKVEAREPNAELDLIELRAASSVTPTVTPTATYTPTPTPTVTPTPTPTATATATNSPTVIPTVTPTVTPPGDVTLSGRVYDAALGLAHGIGGATVSATFCVPRSFQAVSQADGTYSLLLPGLYLSQCTSITLEARATGYQTLTFPFAVADLRAQPVRDLGLYPVVTPTPCRVWIPVILKTGRE